MLDAIKKIFSRTPDGPDWRTVSGWAKSQRFAFKQVPESAGFAVEGKFDDLLWRLEWGPPQRRYISSRELRIRMDLGLRQEIHMMVLSRSLFDLLEQETFDDFTQGNQTYVGSSVPEEMRWVSMWPRAALSGQREVRQHFVALGVNPEVAGAWVEGALGAQLLSAQRALLGAGPPFMLMCHRGRLYLRMELAQADPAALAEALALFAVAAQQILRFEGRDTQAQPWVDSTTATWRALQGGAGEAD